MRTKIPFRWIDGLVVLAIIGYGGYRSYNRPPKTSELSDFARQVNLQPLYGTAVQADGRLRSFESHAKTYIGGYVTGPRSIAGQTYGFTYLDLMFRPENYTEADLIYVKNKDVRKQILDTLASHPQMTKERRDAIMAGGQFPRTLLADPAVTKLLQKLGEDLIRTSKVVDSINSAMTVSDADFLASNLRLVAPPGGELDKLWLPLTELAGASGAPSDAIHAGMAPAAKILPGLAPELQGKIVESWNALRTAWRSQDVAAVNAQVAALASLLPSVSPSLYPSPGRLSMESWYFR